MRREDIPKSPEDELSFSISHFTVMSLGAIQTREEEEEEEEKSVSGPWNYCDYGCCPCFTSLTRLIHSLICHLQYPLFKAPSKNSQKKKIIESSRIIRKLMVIRIGHIQWNANISHHCRIAEMLPKKHTYKLSTKFN